MKNQMLQNKLQITNYKLRTGSGFTLIEIIVAVGIFSIVMLIAVGALLSVISANRNARTTETVVNNLNFALESMTREIRVGTNYHCVSDGDIQDPQNCSNRNFLAFEKSGGDVNDPSDQIVFELQNNRIHRSDDGGSTFLPLTSPSLSIEALRFWVYGAGEEADPDLRLQPRVVIVIKGEVESQQGESEEFNVQTTVAQRLLE